LTARAAVEDRVVRLTHGADAYLTKPFHREELLATMNGLIEQRQKLQEYYSRLISGKNGEEPVHVHQDPFLLKLRSTIVLNMSESQFSVEILSNEMAMSQTQLYRKTKALTGKNPTQLIREIRMNKAMELLKNGETRINEI